MNQHIFGYMQERFGIPKSVFSGYSLYESGGRIMLGPRHELEKIVVSGILIGRAGRTLKPSTNIIQLFGKLATKNVVALSREQAIAVMQGNDINLVDGNSGVTPGYVILSYNGYPLGCGLLKEGKIKNMVPKARRMRVKYL